VIQCKNGVYAGDETAAYLYECYALQLLKKLL
jgi:hypothetical protein